MRKCDFYAIPTRFAVNAIHQFSPRLFLLSFGHYKSSTNESFAAPFESAEFDRSLQNELWAKTFSLKNFLNENSTKWIAQSRSAHIKPLLRSLWRSVEKSSLNQTIRLKFKRNLLTDKQRREVLNGEPKGRTERENRKEEPKWRTERKNKNNWTEIEIQNEFGRRKIVLIKDTPQVLDKSRYYRGGKTQLRVHWRIFNTYQLLSDELEGDESSGRANWGSIIFQRQITDWFIRFGCKSKRKRWPP